MRSDGKLWMRSAWAILCTAAIAGCSPTTEFACDADHTCGADGVCEMNGFCSFPDEDCPKSGRSYGDLSGDLAGACTPDPPPDQDMDGFVDDMDNCKEVRNPDQGNEDGDPFGDVCDLCPISGNNMDRDLDKVGDACDPHPDTPGDSRELFEGFHDGVPTDWDKSGEWTAIGEDDVQVVSSSRAWLSRPVIAANATVIASMTVEAASTERAVAGLIDNQPPGRLDNIAIVCGVAQEMDVAPGMVLNNATSVPQIHPFPWLLATTYQVTLSHVTDDFEGCAVSRPEQTGTAPARMDVPQNNPHHAGLFIEGARVRYHWVMIVASP